MGVLTIFIPALSMEIRGVSVWTKDNRMWFSFPSDEFTLEDGKKAWNPYIKILNEKFRTAFQDSLRDLFKTYLAENAGLN